MLSITPRVGADKHNWKEVATWYVDLFKEVKIVEEELRPPYTKTVSSAAKGVARTATGLGYGVNNVAPAYFSLLIIHRISVDDHVQHAQMFIDASSINGVYNCLINYITTLDNRVLLKLPATASGNAGDIIRDNVDIERNINDILLSSEDDIGMRTRILSEICNIDNKDDEIFRTFFAPIGKKVMKTFSGQSYYVAYRYSTRDEKIVKTLVVITTSSMVVNKRKFLFTHVRKGGNGEIRISRGLVLCHNQSFMFVGITKDHDHINGFKLISLPICGINANYACQTGVYLSNNRAWHPISGRIYMIHLGFYGQDPASNRIDHNAANVKILRVDELSNDLDELNNKFRIFDRSKMTKDVMIDRVLSSINNMRKTDRDEMSCHQGVRRAIAHEDDNETEE
jgi:hypothetical protein